MKLKKYNAKYLASTQYINYYRKCEINDKIIFLEAQSGNNVNGNIFYLLKELLTDSKYSCFKVYLSVEEKAMEKTHELLKTYDLKPNIVSRRSKDYYKLLASAKYLFNDTSFIPSFIKKPGQIITNVWHGTPLKTLGKKDNGGYHAIGNVQKNFVIADYLLYPSEYMRKHMIEDYMLENLSDAKCIINGYPRNSAFFNEENQDIIDALNASDKQIIGYMPTWRGTVGAVKSNEETVHVMHYLYNLDKELRDDQLLLVNLHPFVSDGINYKVFKHIRSFPKGYETYDILNVCDTLITDYSSVFFDYAVKNKKIILFTYDEEEYLRDRGMYISMDSLPFVRVDNEKDLLREINTPINYETEDFLKEYCSKENKNASSQLLDYVLFNEKNDLEVKDIERNGKENILIYGGNLAKNGITTALMNLLNNIDLEEYNYYICFPSLKVADHKEVLRSLPDKVGYIPLGGTINSSLSGLFQLALLLVSKKMHFYYSLDNKVIHNMYSLEKTRNFSNVKFKHVIHFTGYEMQKQLLFGHFDCERTIYVHNNMVEEIKLKGNSNPNVLRYAYNHYDNVVMVSEDMREPTKAFCFDENKMKVVHNFIDYKKVLRLAQENISFDQETSSNMSLEDISSVLNSQSKVFVSIGRFSKEKGHLRLMNSFYRLWKENPDIYLMIIGGYGPMYEETLAYANKLECCHHIMIIKSLSNPYAFLKRCDYFVLSSFHEAFGLVLAEADILDIPVMSTDILGPKGFMEKHGGLLVPNNEEGIYKGMKLMLESKVKPLCVDYEKYNQDVIRQLDTILNLGKHGE